MARPSRTDGKTSKAKAARKPSRAKGRKTARSKRRIVPTVTRAKRRPVSGLSKDLEEAREQQAATAEILKVIASSPSDVQPVFEAIVANADKLIGGFSTAVYSHADETLQLKAFTRKTPEADAALQASYPRSLSALPDGDERLRKGEVVQIADVEVEWAESPAFLEVARLRGFRSNLLVPLLRDQAVIGLISITRRAPGQFADHHVQLLKTFADQAVIAIGNVRLFEEVQAKTRDLSESLQFQTASSDVLKVISSSPDRLQPVLEAIVQTSRELCGSDASTVFLLRDGKFHFTAVSGEVPKHLEYLRDHPASIDDLPFKRMVREKRTLHFPNVMDDTELSLNPRTALGGPRALVVTPLLRDGEALGAIVLRQSHLRPFTPRQIQAIEAFADQAVIAIQNARLFNETREALERQTATADILKVIASSRDDVQPVFEAIAERSNRIVDGRSTAVYSLVDGMLHLMAFTPTSPEADATLRAFFPRPLSEVNWGEPISRGEVGQILDLYDPSIPPGARKLAEQRGFRSLMVVPLVSEQKIIGVISVTRAAPGKFSDNHVQLMQTFSDQAVIAISNVELFQEVQQRTKDLSQSLDDLRAAQDRLVQTEKLASLGQLTAGIAHEIKNPLNFVNNFSALSAELTEELNDVLKPVAMDGKVRGEVDELTGLLKENLQKVVQHGKRADSIVKNMLLHSREGSREHRPADINSLLDESLNLAYHGARAEKGEFNITLQRDFDTDVGAIELFPQEITRAFLNLIANGVYAATKRKTEVKEPGFEPTLRATTKNLGNAVEIRVWDNGSGIPLEVQEKMFNPFFTTKPAGEGTGLGLSMTHDIIVKQHGGRIDVATEAGQFTEFKIVLPRSGPKQ